MTTDRELADEIELYLEPDATYHLWEPSMEDMEQIIAALRRSQPEGEMNAKRAKAILGDGLQEDGSIYSLGHYMSWDVGDDDICLDDRFTIEELQAILFFMLAAAAEGRKP